MMTFSFQTANSEFCKAKASNQSAGKREAMLKDLAAGFDMYIELTDNLKEGTKVTFVLRSYSRSIYNFKEFSAFYKKSLFYNILCNG